MPTGMRPKRKLYSLQNCTWLLCSQDKREDLKMYEWESGLEKHFIRIQGHTGLGLLSKLNFSFYRAIKSRVEVWENETCCGNTSRSQVFPWLFRVLQNFQERFYNSTGTRRTCFLFLSGNTTRKIGKQLVNFDYQDVNSFLPRLSI